MALDRKIAYFSMEVGLESEIPTYSGGLGVLAGDTLRSAADLGLPVVGLSLHYSNGYFYQKIDEDGKQIEVPAVWDSSSKLEKLPNQIKVKIEDRDVKVGAWKYNIKGVNGDVPVYLLDTNIEGNKPWDRSITQQLYGGENYHRLTQEVVLGSGGVKMLENLGYKVDTYHMNEGHASFLTLELLRKYKDENKVKQKCMFTTHTPVPAGHDVFSYKLAIQVMNGLLPININQLAGSKMLNTTKLALNLSRYANGVAQKHGEVSRNMFPGYDIHAITNGVHSATWTAPEFQKLYDKYIPGWREDPQHFNYVFTIPTDELWNAHMSAKKRLLDYVKQENHMKMDEDTLTIGFARRFTPYKRPDLILKDLGRLLSMGSKKMQLVFAGKTHPRDAMGKDMIQKVVHNSKMLRDHIKIAFVENYDMDLGQLITSGVDVWLNNPKRPQEASGTSGMKATHNGVLNFSVLDGWWIEGYQMNPFAGWSIGPEATETKLVNYDESIDALDLYDKLGGEIIPTFYDKKDEWKQRMKHAITLASFFNTHRMVGEYGKVWKK